MGSVFGSIPVAQPAFEVLAQTAHYQVRRYSALIVAETQMKGDTKQANNEAFLRLARYIGVFGVPENQGPSQAPEKIAMTAPVTNSASAIPMTAPVINDTIGESMAFVLPADLTLETAPKPTNPLVHLREQPGQDVAVFTYTWTTNTEDALHRVPGFVEQLLPEHRAHVKIGPDGSVAWTLNRYNPPFTLPFLKTNEVWITLNRFS
eukprot:c10553_g1_i2.p1 GENE.c10553_g1_i2~~c10553_g1_i2.p1  ORF type:complete len:206 (+),score=24.80 c10553_g1_i2:50-667(+)